MARGINKVTIVGNLGADPDTRYSANGNAVTKISVATSDVWKDKQTGDQQERTEWHRIVFFSRLAEIAAEYLRKGSQVYVEGSLRTSSYEKDGQKHYSTDIIGREMQMLGSRQGQGGHNLDSSDNSGSSQKSSTSKSGGQSGGMDDFDDDIPF